MPKSHPETLRQAEESRTTRPAHIYLIEHLGETFHLAGHDEPIMVTGLPLAKGADPQTFTPAQIQHTSNQQTSDIGSNTMQLAIGINESPFSDQLRQMLLFNAPRQVTVTIVRVNSQSMPGPIGWGDDTFVTFKGVMTHLTFENAQMQLALVSIILNADGKCPRYFWQKTCQHALYGPSCNADPDAVENHIVTTAAVVDGRARSVDIADLTIDAEPIEPWTFQGGTLIVMSDGSDPVELARISIAATEILPASAGVRLFMSWWSPELADGVDLVLLRGCQRTMAACSTFPRVGESDPSERLEHFGGQPWIPDINLTVQGIR
jgi:hypothetical protein